MQEKQILSRISKAEQRIVDLYHRLRQNLGGSISINDNAPVSNLSIGPVLEETYENGTLQISIDPYPGYNVYRAKIATESIDWPGYGYLYNGHAITDIRNLANPDGGSGQGPSNEWKIPTNTEWDSLIAGLENPLFAGELLRVDLDSTTYPFYGWSTPSYGVRSNNPYNFSAVPGGLRYETGSFLNANNVGYFWSNETTGGPGTLDLYFLANFSPGLFRANMSKDRGLSVRLVRNAVPVELGLIDGHTSVGSPTLAPYTGNDGKVYPTVKIGTQIWLAENLRETQYANGNGLSNASIFAGGDSSTDHWQAMNLSQIGAYTTYLYNDQSFFPLDYDPSEITVFQNDVLENTFDPTYPLIWLANQAVDSFIYYLRLAGLGWKKTHIKVTPGYDREAFPLIKEKSLVVLEAVAGPSTSDMKFLPIEKDNTGVVTIKNLNNYSASLGAPTSYIYLEILEYQPVPVYYDQSVGIGVSNL